MLDFYHRKCKTKAAYSAKLKRQQKLDLGKIKDKFPVILETPVLLVITVEGIEIVVRGYGELLFKNCADVDLMESIAKENLFRRIGGLMICGTI